MELIFAHQVGFDKLKELKFDYCLVASGYEDRCTYLPDNITINAGRKIALAFDDGKNFLFREKNDRRFREEGFYFIEESASRTDKIYGLLDEICEGNRNREKISILVDYSCMSKTWYAGILQYFILKELEINNLEIYFSYTSALFSEPQDLPLEIPQSSPVHLLRASVHTSKPHALILGLGYDKFLRKEMIEQLDHQILYAFYSDPAFDNRYIDRVVSNNGNILNCLPDDHIIRYPVDDLKKTDALLTSLTMKLRLNFRVSILPVGPKPFTLSSLLLAARYPDIGVWGIQTPGTPAYSRHPTGEPMICKVVFSSDGEEFL